MASVSTSSRGQVHGNLDTATDSSDAITVNGGQLVDLIIGSVTSGSVIDLQGEAMVNDADGALTFQTIASYSADTFVTLQFASQRRLRLNAASIAGGDDVFYEMTVGNRE